MRVTALLTVLCTAGAGEAGAQGMRARDRVQYVQPTAIPGVFQRYIHAAGDRFSKPGKERLVCTGSATIAGQSSTFTAIAELPGKVRIQYGPQGRVVTFDLERSSAPGSVDDADEAVLETFAYDSTDRFLFGIAEGTLPRVLGFAFRPDSSVPPAPAVDIYQVFQMVASRRNQDQAVKHFEFDSQTGLLQRIVYLVPRDNHAVAVEVNHSDYADVDAQNVAQRIVRREDGQIVADIHIAQVQFQPKQHDNAFAKQ